MVTTLWLIRINHKVVTTFQHVRAERLAKCLLLASEAVGRQDALVLNVDHYKPPKPE